MIKKQIIIVPIEKLENRYTYFWYDHVPKILDEAIKARNLDIDITIINGDDVPPTTTPGAFLDFGATNIYKSSQTMIIAELFRQGKIKSGDKFLYTDAWNPGIIQVKYMADLYNVDLEFHSMWHANSLDPQDFLGRLIGDKPWIRHAEKSMFHCFDKNWFATNFSANLCNPFKYASPIEYGNTKTKIGITGWPMEYLEDILGPYKNATKKNQIVFPHRLAPEKQLNIFEDLAQEMPEYDWVVCQKTNLTKHEYHTILSESKLCFSASLQETYGISMLESLMVNCYALMPKRLSYAEIFANQQELLYPSEWTSSWNNYLIYKSNLIDTIKKIMDTDQNEILKITNKFQTETFPKCGHADNLINALLQ